MDVLSKVESSAKLFLVFVMGGALSYAGAFPFKPYLHDAFLGTSAVTRQLMATLNVCGTDVWYDAKALGRDREKTGLILAEAGHDAQGLVLATVGQAAKLLNRKGDVVHEWKLAYGDLPTGNGPVSSYIPDNLLYWQRAVALPDGDLIAMVNANCLSPDGLALVRLDKDSNVKWVRHGHYHHDFSIGPDGNIYTLWQSPVSELPARYASVERPLLDEGIEVLSPEGESLKRVSILSAFAASTYSSIIESSLPAFDTKPGDRMHNNNVDVLTAEQAKAIPGASTGDILLSMRELGTLATLNLETQKISWATRGSWFMQHDPDMLPNGNILLFDNMGDWRRFGQSRVMEIHPATEMIAWQYPDRSASPDMRFYTHIRGEQELLANGNILVNETQGNRLLEVTRDQKIVWEYACPFVDPSGQRCNTMSSRPYAPSDLPFLAALPAKSAMAEPLSLHTLD